MQNIYFCICKTICFAQVYVFAYAKIYTLYKTYSFAYAKYIVLRMYMVLHAASSVLSVQGKGMNSLSLRGVLYLLPKIRMFCALSQNYRHLPKK